MLYFKSLESMEWEGDRNERRKSRSHHLILQGYRSHYHMVTHLSSIHHHRLLRRSGNSHCYLRFLPKVKCQVKQWSDTLHWLMILGPDERGASQWTGAIETREIGGQTESLKAWRSNATSEVSHVARFGSPRKTVLAPLCTPRFFGERHYKDIRKIQ